MSKNRSLISYPEQGNAHCLSVEDNSFWFKHRNNCIIELVKQFPPSGPIFDIGGGNGYVSLGLKQNGFKTVLVEPGIEGVRNAKQKGLQPIICSTFEDINFPKNSIHAIGIFDVLEHIEDDISFLKKIHSSMQKNSKLYITVPAYKWLWSKDDDFAGHYRRYTLQNLRKKLSSTNFKIKFATYIFSFLPIPILLFRVIPSLFGLRKNIIEHTANEHKIKKGLTESILEYIFSYELIAIQKRKAIPFGGSCLISAVKN